MRPVGILLLGVSVGLQYGLLAVGLVLIHRASRFVNFAQGQLGVVAAIVLARLLIDAHLPYGVALAGGLLAAAGTAALVERSVIQRLFEAPRLVLLIATIAITQGLFGITQFKGFHLGHTKVLPASPLRLDQGKLVRAGGFPVPFSTKWTVGGVVLDSAQLLTIVVAPAIVFGLYLLFTRTRFGRAIRAASSNPEAARLAGISVRRVSLQVWVVAGVLSGLAAVLGAPSQPTVTASLLGPGLLLRGLAAALLAGFVDFRIAFVGGIVVGVVEQVAQYNVHSPGITDLAVLAVLVVGLVWRAPALARAYRRGDDLLVEGQRADGGDTGLARRRRQANIGGWVVLVAVLAVLPWVHGLHDQAHAQALTQLLTMAIVGMSLTLLTGWAGQVSLGHFALLAVGAYVSAHTLTQHHWAFPAVLAVSGAATAVAALVVGLPAIRFRGLFLAVTTLGLAVVGPSWLFYQRILGAHSGAAQVQLTDVRLPFGGFVTSYRQLYLLTLGILVLVALALAALRASGAGRAFVAIRDNERAATSAGLSPALTKAAALALSGFITGIAGGLWAMSQSSFGPAAFDAGQSLIILSVTIVGGLGTIAGPVLGAFAVFAWPFLVPGQNNVVIRSITSTSLLLTVLLYLPGGFASLVHAARERLIRRLPRLTVDVVDVDPPPAPVRDTAGALAPVPGAPPLVVHDVAIAFGGIRALDGVSLRVEPGEIVGLIGGNGAGKTTLMDCISGHLQPAQGRIELFGRDVTDLPPQFRAVLGVGRSFQDASLYAGLDVLETVMLPLDQHDRNGVVASAIGAPWVAAAERRKAARALASLREVGLDSRAGTPTSALSTGTRRLTDLASVTVVAPGLLLLDEPTAGVAQREVEAFGPMLRRIRDELGCSILLIEHDMPLVMSVSDRIYCLQTGRVISAGTPAEVREDPAVIASYLGTDPTAVARSGAVS